MTNTRRVVVTGIGLVSSLGIGTDANWQALKAGCSGVTRITKFDASQFATQIAGEVKGFDPLAFVEKKDVKKEIKKEESPILDNWTTNGAAKFVNLLNGLLQLRNFQRRRSPSDCLSESRFQSNVIGIQS